MKTDLEYEQSPFKIDYAEKNLLRMNLNENLVLPLARMRSVLVKCIDKIDPRINPSEATEGETVKLKGKIAEYCGCFSRSVGLGSGSDQIIDIAYRMSLGKGGKTVTVDPTYSMYSIFAKRIGAPVLKVKLGLSTA